jgi:hypothetical protein
LVGQRRSFINLLSLPFFTDTRLGSPQDCSNQGNTDESAPCSMIGRQNRIRSTTMQRRHAFVPFGCLCRKLDLCVAKTSSGLAPSSSATISSSSTTFRRTKSWRTRGDRSARRHTPLSAPILTGSEPHRDAIQQTQGL